MTLRSRAITASVIALIAPIADVVCFW